MGNDYSPDNDYQPKVYAGPVYMPLKLVPVPKSQRPSKAELMEHYNPIKKSEDIEMKASMLVAMKDSYGNIL